MTYVYAPMPRQQQIIIQLTLGLAWLFVAAAGISQIIIVPPGNLLDYAGLGVAAAAIVAASGVLMLRYRLEWISAWLAAAFLVPTLIVSWIEGVLKDPAVIPGSLLTSALAAFFVVRAQMCAAHAARLRAIHEQPVVMDE